jgi:hypothetical protein
MEGRDNKEQIVDVRSVVEAISTADNNDINVPLYEVESLCMRCRENVFPLSFFLKFLCFLCVSFMLVF